MHRSQFKGVKYPTFRRYLSVLLEEKSGKINAAMGSVINIFIGNIGGINILQLKYRYGTFKQK